LRDADLLNHAVREAGRLALGLFHSNPRQWRKADGSIVTEADIAVDRLLRDRLAGARPDYGWLSEESPDDGTRLGRERVWIADPIDGTRSFARGGDQWCVAAALLDGGRPSAAAVYRPVGEQFYEAQAGSGARLNGVPLRRASRASASGARAIGSRATLKKLAPLGIEETGGAFDIPLLLRLCFIAAGDYDIAISTGRKNDWDLAAGDLILREAGGIVTGLRGRPFTFNRPEPSQAGLLASDSGLHETILAAMAAA
jgi:myo-inositol-1(or 4)-monophosphatase